MNVLEIIEKEIASKQSQRNFTPKIPALLEEDENERIKAILIPKIDRLESDVFKIFQEIKNTPNLEQADPYFDLLLKYLEKLGWLYWKFNVTLSVPMEKFVRDFERLDDSWTREYYFEKIKNGSYSL